MSLFFSLPDIDPKMLMSEVMKEFGLDQNTVEFIGHALCLYRDDEYVVIINYCNLDQSDWLRSNII